MTHPNAALVERFYTALHAHDGEAMAACYADDVHFSDPVFPELRGRDAGDMWRMLTEAGKDLRVEASEIVADDTRGSAHWIAHYTFSATGRSVVNDIRARFTFRNGKIVEHVDTFNLWRWSRQALGAPGLLLGWSPLIRNAIRKKAGGGLRAFQKKRAGER